MRIIGAPPVDLMHTVYILKCGMHTGFLSRQAKNQKSKVFSLGSFVHNVPRIVHCAGPHPSRFKQFFFFVAYKNCL